MTSKYIKDKTIDVVGIGYRGGQPRGGVEFGPDALRNGGIVKEVATLGWKVNDNGNIKFDDFSPDTDQPAYGIKFPRTVGRVCEKISTQLSEYHKKGHGVLVLGGDHSLAIGSISASSSAYDDLCVVWVDAHADINTPKTSPTGNIHGMPVAFLMQLDMVPVPGFDWLSEKKLTPERIVYVGLRDVDEGEKEILKKLNIKAFSMTEVDHYGINQVMKMALDHVCPNRDKPIHLSFDVDGIDPYDVPSTGTPVRGGLSYREARYLCERISETGNLVSMDIVEVNPKLGTEDEVKRTVSTSVDLAKYAFGQTLL